MTVQADPLAVRCPYCRALQNCPCRVGWNLAPAKRPHKKRVKLALVLAAHSDPVLDAHFVDSGPCGLCGTPGLGARHRVVDAVAGATAAGQEPEVTAADYNITEEAVAAVQRWMAKWDGAWK